MAEIIIDAEGRTLGRIATEAARHLMAKTTVGYSPSSTPKTRVKIINLSGAKIPPKKLEQKTYKKYSGYPGNLKRIPLKKLMEENNAIVFKKIVWGMLPKNKLRKKILKNLVVEP